MEEKVIIKSKHYNMKKIKGIIFGIPSALLGLGILLYLCNFDRSRGPNYWGEYWTILDNMFDPFSFLPGLLIDLGLIICIIGVVIGLWLKSYSMTVTDKRIYGSIEGCKGKRNQRTTVVMCGSRRTERAFRAWVGLYSLLY